MLKIPNNVCKAYPASKECVPAVRAGDVRSEEGGHLGFYICFNRGFSVCDIVRCLGCTVAHAKHCCNGQDQ